MFTRYYFQDFARLLHLENHLDARIRSTVDHFIPSGRYELFTRVQTTRARSSVKKPKYLCEIKLDTPQSNNAIVISKKGFNLYDAVTRVSDALKKVLRRQSSLRSQHNRRQHKRVIEGLRLEPIKIHRGIT